MLRRFERSLLCWKNVRRCFASLPSTGKHAVSQRNTKSRTSSFQYQVIAEVYNAILYRPGGLVHLRIQLTICQLSRMSSSLEMQLTFRLQNSQMTMYQHSNFPTDNQCSRYFTETNAHIERIRYQSVTQLSLPPTGRCRRSSLAGLNQHAGNCPQAQILSPRTTLENPRRCGSVRKRPVSKLGMVESVCSERNFKPFHSLPTGSWR